MLKKTVKYTDYNGVEKIKDVYFNFNAAEITELELSLNGGLSKLLDKITKESDQSAIIEYFKKFVVMAYGEKTIDGEGFIKNDEIREKFIASPIYSKLFMEFALNAQAAAEFTKAVIPSAELEKYSEQIEANALAEAEKAGEKEDA